MVTDAAASELLAGDLERGRRSFADENGRSNLTGVKLIGRQGCSKDLFKLARP